MEPTRPAISSLFSAILQAEPSDLKSACPLSKLTDVVTSHFDVLGSLYRQGNPEWKHKMEALSETIRHKKGYGSAGKELAHSINKFVKKLISQPSEDIDTFIENILKIPDPLYDYFSVPDLVKMMRANAKPFYSKRDHALLRENLRILADRITREYSISIADVLAAGIKSLASKMEAAAEGREIGKTVAKHETPIPAVSKQPSFKTAKEEINYAIENQLLFVILLEYTDLTDKELARLIKGCPNIQTLWISSKNITKLPSEASKLELLVCSKCNISEIPTFPNLRILHCRDNPSLYIHSQPKLEELHCDFFGVTLEQPVNVTKFNFENFDFFKDFTG